MRRVLLFVVATMKATLRGLVRVTVATADTTVLLTILVGATIYPTAWTSANLSPESSGMSSSPEGMGDKYTSETTSSVVTLTMSSDAVVRGLRVFNTYGLSLSSDILTYTHDRFLGIAFAKPPTGKRRFKAPERLEPGDRIQVEGPPRVCPQIPFHVDTRIQFQNEDCLYLNVYAPYQPARSNDQRYPVMVYIHGGSYEVGAGSLYDGGVLAQKGVVVVTVNYRLGALGFLSSGDSILPGNYGILDQIEALMWVQDNIAKFRGDPNCVTLFGHSVGASSVGLMMVIPQAQGLFHRVIAQSGAATAPYSTHNSNNANFRMYILDVGRIFACGSGATGEKVEDEVLRTVIDCLRQVPAQNFIAERGKFPLYDPIDPEFRPFVDGVVLPDIPHRLFELRKFARVPVIVGTVKDEFANYFNGGERHRVEFDQALDNYIEKVLHYDQFLVDVVKFKYTDWSNTSAIVYLRGDLLSDMHMIAPIAEMADMLSDGFSTGEDTNEGQGDKDEDDDDSTKAGLNANGMVWEYHFSAPISFHSIELNYVFGSPFNGHFADEMTVNGNVNDSFNELDRRLSLRMMGMWVHFARHGRPTPDDGVWSSYSSQSRGYLHLSARHVEMKYHLRSDKVAFWNSLIPTIRNSSIHSSKTAVMRMPSSDNPLSPPIVSLWILLAIICLLLAMVFLVTTLYIKSIRNNRRRNTATTIYAATNMV